MEGRTVLIKYLFNEISLLKIVSITCYYKEK